MVDLKTVVVTKKNITLTWADPVDNGGSDIIGYEVLRKDAKMKLFRQPIETASCKCDIQGLLAGEEYDFRVVARNKYGDGAPADIGPILAEDPKGNCLVQSLFSAFIWIFFLCKPYLLYYYILYIVYVDELKN